MEVLGVALLGCGRIARRVHIDALLALRDVRLVAVADTDAEARAAAAARVPGAREAADLETLLAMPEVEAVVVCLPNHLHAQAGRAVLEAGRHLYLEKPMALDEREAATLLDAWGASGRVAAIGHNLRANPIYGDARRDVAAGLIGRVVGVRTTFCSVARELPDWKRARATGGGALLDLAGHHADIVQWLLGADAVEVCAEISSVRTEHDTAAVTYRLSTGPLVQTFTSISAGDEDRIELVGDSGRLVLDRYGTPHSRHHGSRRRSGRGERLADAAAVLMAAPRRALDTARPAPEDSFRRSLQAFADACGGHGHPVADLADGARSLRLLLAAEQSAGTGRRVTIDGGLVP